MAVAAFVTSVACDSSATEPQLVAETPNPGGAHNVSRGGPDPRPGGSFRPRPREPTVDAELPWWPRFHIGKRELRFPGKKPLQGTNGVVLPPGDGRYRVVNGRVASLQVDVLTDPSKLSAGDYRREIIGTTVDELRAKIQAVAAH